MGKHRDFPTLALSRSGLRVYLSFSLYQSTPSQSSIIDTLFAEGQHRSMQRCYLGDDLYF